MELAPSIRSKASGRGTESDAGCWMLRQPPASERFWRKLSMTSQLIADKDWDVAELGLSVLGTCWSRLSRRCVRLRSRGPAGATLSSSCTTCTFFHGTDSSDKARNICQGVCPLLTAMTKLPRAPTEAAASAA